MGKTYAILNATILDGTAEMKAMANHGVIVGSEGRIEEVGPSERLRVEKDMNVIDLGGKVLMPGLTKHARAPLRQWQTDERQSGRRPYRQGGIEPGRHGLPAPSHKKIGD